jgi:putative transposase
MESETSFLVDYFCTNSPLKIRNSLSMNILSLFACFQTLARTATIRQLSVISQAVLTMTGRIRMLSISRWTDQRSGSYRTLQRFFATALPWSELLCRFFQTHLFNPEDEYILAGDATTVTKSGSRTNGVGIFFLESWAKRFAASNFLFFRSSMSHKARRIRS